MSDSASSSKGSKLCELCKNEESRYCCPRCEVLYCSLECYKGDTHLNCSENFYRDCVNEELASQNPDEESRQRMIAILKRMKDNLDELDDLSPEPPIEGSDTDSDDDSEDLALQERIKNIDLNDADAVWAALTPDERNEFVALVNEGDLSKILPQWNPWWTYNKDGKLVQDIFDEEEELALKRCPLIMEVPKLSEITTVTPSQTIRYNITNVLASYAFVMRYFNGEVNPVETVSYVMAICATLDTNANFDDAGTAVESVTQNCLQSQLIETDEESIEVMKRDTFFLLQGPSDDNQTYYCKAALSHLYAIMADAKTALKEQKPQKEKLNTTPSGEPNVASEQNVKGSFTKKFPDHKGDYLPILEYSKLKKCMKKLEFYLSFVETYGMEFE